ncbi:MAG: uroporphyrinogen-III synthase [Bacteroidetes bacterium]|nr:uroporphyrinogen-III synthase [Bacteroidota bacterium]
MQKNKAYLLSTMELPQSLIDEAAANDVLIDAFAFIKVNPIKNQKLKDRIAELSGKSSTVVFTSMNAAENIIEELRSLGIKPKWDIYCMSGTTKKIIAAYFGENSIKGSANNAVSLSGEIIKDNIKAILFFCGNQRRDELPSLLKEHHIGIDEIIVYETILTPKELSKQYNGVLFFSPSAAKSFFSANELDERTVFFAIGTTTANTIKEYSQNKIIVSQSPGKEILVKNCIEYFQTDPVH